MKSLVYPINAASTYDADPLMERNPFIGREKDTLPLPAWEESRAALPALVWDGHEDAVRCYDKAWELAFSHLRAAEPGDGMVSNYIDSAFNEFLFMWDAAFMTLFGKYGVNVFPFQRTLDNFYANQHKDGYICRAICETEKGDRFTRHDPAGTGPNILAWAEWENFSITGDLDRVRAVYPAILAYHRWLRKNRTWPDGSYWSTGWACGMDNQPRLQPAYSHRFSHGHMVWADACIQQLLSAKCLLRMADVTGEQEGRLELRTEVETLTAIINDKLWDKETAFYYDLWKDGRRNGVKSIGAYWALLAGVVPGERLDAFVAHLANPAEFNRPHPIPSLSADHPDYSVAGSYWRGGVWAPTNYMVLKGLRRNGYHDLAYDIALRHVEMVTQVFRETGTLWENYAPEGAKPGDPAKPDFVGWTGLSAIAIPIEHVFGIESRPEENKIIWRVRETTRHGVLRYPFKGGTVDLICPAHREGQRPEIELRSTVPVAAEVAWAV